jgi:hypothetical protein
VHSQSRWTPRNSSTHNQEPTPQPNTRSEGVHPHHHHAHSENMPTPRRDHTVQRINAREQQRPPNATFSAPIGVLPLMECLTDWRSLSPPLTGSSCHQCVIVRRASTARRIEERVDHVDRVVAVFTLLVLSWLPPWSWWCCCRRLALRK